MSDCGGGSSGSPHELIGPMGNEGGGPPPLPMKLSFGSKWGVVNGWSNEVSDDPFFVGVRSVEDGGRC